MLFLLVLLSVFYVLVFLILFNGGDAKGAVLLMLIAIVQVVLCLVLLLRFDKVVRSYEISLRDKDSHFTEITPA